MIDFTSQSNMIKTVHLFIQNKNVIFRLKKKIIKLNVLVFFQKKHIQNNNVNCAPIQKKTFDVYSIYLLNRKIN